VPGLARALRHNPLWNVGVIPVCDGDKLVGMVTDRDIVARAVAQSLDGKNLVARGARAQGSIAHCCG